jgi:Ca2+-binding EF-hand superfamily protein
MKPDIVEMLRFYHDNPTRTLTPMALADILEARAEIERLREALEEKRRECTPSAEAMQAAFDVWKLARDGTFSWEELLRAAYMADSVRPAFLSRTGEAE